MCDCGEAQLKINNYSYSKEIPHLNIYKILVQPDGGAIRISKKGMSIFVNKHLPKICLVQCSISFSLNIMCL